MGMKALQQGLRPVTLEELEVVYRRDAAAFEEIAGAIVGDEELGCDAVQDAFVQALPGERSPASGSSTYEHQTSWLSSSGSSTCSDVPEPRGL